MRSPALCQSTPSSQARHSKSLERCPLHPPGLGEVLGVELPPDTEAQRVQAQALAHRGQELQGKPYLLLPHRPQDAQRPGTPNPLLTSFFMAGGQLGVARDRKEGK